MFARISSPVEFENLMTFNRVGSQKTELEFWSDTSDTNKDDYWFDC